MKKTNRGTTRLVAFALGIIGIFGANIFSLYAADPPGIMNQQGRIAVDGTNFDGAGHFKFALTNAAGNMTYWSNDGTTGEPTAAVPADVTKGHYSVALGDTTLTNMTAAIPPGVFTDNTVVHLRVWFSADGGTTFEELTPAQRITATGYALSAAQAEGVKTGGVTSPMIANGAISSANLGAGSITTDKIANNAITMGKIAPGAVNTVQLADGAVTVNHLKVDSETGATNETGTVAFGDEFDVPPVVEIDAGNFQNEVSLSNVNEDGFDLAVNIAQRKVDGTSNASGEHVSMAIVAGRPAIAYYNATTRDLMYARAKDADGHEWNTPVIVENDGSAITGHYPTLMVVNGRPAVSFHNFSRTQVRYKRASDASGTAWPAAPVILDGTSSSVGFYCRGAIIGGRPSVAYWSNSTGKVYFIRADDVDGVAWPAPKLASGPGGGFNISQQIGLDEIGGMPAIAYGRNSQIFYARATQVDGNAWPNSITVVPSPDGVVSPNFAYPVSLRALNGKPAIFFPKSSAGNNPVMLRAPDANGMTANSWTSQVIDSTVDARYVSATLIGGKAAIACWTTNGDLRVYQATDADATTWGPATIMRSGFGPDVWNSVLEVNGQPAVAFHYDGPDDLYYATVPNVSWTATSGGAFPIQAANVADGGVTSSSLANGAVTTASIANNAITSALVANGSLTGTDLNQNNSIKAGHLASNSVGSSELAANSVSSGHVVDGSLTGSDLNADDSITAAHLGSNSVGSSELQSNSVFSDEIADGTITSSDINGDYQLMSEVNGRPFVPLGASNLSETNGNGSFSVGSPAGIHLGFGQQAINAYNNNTPTRTYIGRYGGGVDIGDSGSTNKMFGNVGIGGTPDARFHIMADGTGIGDGLKLTGSLGNGADWYQYMNSTDDLVFRDDGNDVVTFKNSTGRVGIGTTAPSHLLHVNGVARSTSSTWATSSDRRAKENIVALNGSLEKVGRLRPVTFEYTAEYTADRSGYEGEFTGFVAQEFAEVFPESVDQVEEAIGSKTVKDFNLLNISGLLPHVVAAVQELKTQKDAEISELKTENDDLKTRLEKLEAAMAKLSSGSNN